MVSRPENNPQIVSLNLLRGLAALYVCIFHVFNHNEVDAYPFLRLFSSYGYLGLDLFFIISGFIIPYSMHRYNYSWKSFPKFFLKRTVRIEPPYIVSFLLILLLRLVYTYSMHGQFVFNGVQFVLHFFYLNQYFGYEPYTIVYWTLAIEFQFYLLIGLLYPLIMSKSRWIPLLILTVFAGVCLRLYLPYNWFIFQYGFLFATGIVLFLFRVGHITRNTFIALLFFIFVLTYIKNGADALVISVIACLTILFLKRHWKITDFFGKISYSFYLLHLEITGWFMLLFHGIITEDVWLRVGAVAVAIGFATGFYYLFERPALNLSKKISYRT